MTLTNGHKPRFVDGYLAYLLARASFLISNEFHATLARRRIPVMHWRVLATLNEGPLSIKELADFAQCKQSTMSRVIDRMEDLGLLRRTADTVDRRSIRVAVTPKGKLLAQKLMKLAKEHEHTVLEPFGQADGRTLMNVLRKLIELHVRER